MAPENFHKLDRTLPIRCVDSSNRHSILLTFTHVVRKRNVAQNMTVVLTLSFHFSFTFIQK